MSLVKMRVRAAKPRGEGKGVLSPSRSRVLGRLASLAQIGELARRLRFLGNSND